MIISVVIPVGTITPKTAQLIKMSATTRSTARNGAEFNATNEGMHGV
jgi:hypothetical protein